MSHLTYRNLSMLFMILYMFFYFRTRFSNGKQTELTINLIRRGSPDPAIAIEPCNVHDTWISFKIPTVWGHVSSYSTAYHIGHHVASGYWKRCPGCCPNQAISIDLVLWTDVVQLTFILALWVLVYSAIYITQITWNICSAPADVHTKADFHNAVAMMAGKWLRAIVGRPHWGCVHGGLGSHDYPAIGACCCGFAA